MNTVFITGSAGFIGFHLSKRLLLDGFNVVGLDNLTNYYDVKLKHSRNNILSNFKHFTFYKKKLEDFDNINKIFNAHNPQIIIHLAAQAGVRYSIDNPKSYVDSNLIGTANILEIARIFKVTHLLIASTSSAYGSNKKMPFDERVKCNTPLSFYAATKLANESMSHSYSHLFKIPTTVFRFFTVYGPWGRPDMALFKFTKSIIENKELVIYNNGNMKRDFTFIDDLINAINLLIKKIPDIEDTKHDIQLKKIDSISPVAPFRIVNIGNSKPINLLNFLNEIENSLGKKAKVKFEELQLGDVEATYSDITLLRYLTGFTPNTSLQKGVKIFTDWYKSYYKI